MAEWRLCFVLLLLPLTLCCESGTVTLVKTIRDKALVTPVCTNSTSDPISLIVCRIGTNRSREECRLLYQHGHDFVSECDSRFTLMMWNHTVFLRLTSLTPEDSGNHTCECSYTGETCRLLLNITVEDDENIRTLIQVNTVNLSILLGASVLILSILTGIIVGITRAKRRKNYRVNLNVDLKSATSGSSAHEAVDGDDPDDPYTSLQQPANDIYQTVSSVHCRSDSVTNSDSSEVTVRDSDPSFTMYENI